jgi:CHAT domain
VAVSDSERLTLVLRFADVGVATYASLRVVGQPARTVTWVVEEPILLAALEELADALPDPHAAEDRREAVDRALSTGPFAAPATELMVAYRLGVLLIAAQAWQLLMDCVSAPRATLFVSPSARLARVPWGLLAMPTSGPSAEDLIRARAQAITRTGTTPARIPWQTADISLHTEGHRLMELVDVLMAVPSNIVHSPRIPAGWDDRRDGPPVLVLDPRVPGQRPDSALGSVLGRPSPQTQLARHFAELMQRRRVLPDVDTSVDLFRRSDADREWLVELLAQAPSRLLFVGHATAADGDLGHADRAALHLAEERPLTAADLMSLHVPMPPRVAMLACASGSDYQFDEATGLVAAMILGGAQLVTATLWSLPTAAGYRQFAPAGDAVDPMADVIVAVDTAHETDAAGRAVNRWQREQMRRWRDGDVTASPLHWAALATFAVDGAR